MKNILSIFSSVFLAPFIIYVFNMMAGGLNIFIPINIVTIFIVGFLKILGLVMLIILLFVF